MSAVNSFDALCELQRQVYYAIDAACVSPAKASGVLSSMLGLMMTNIINDREYAERFVKDVVSLFNDRVTAHPSWIARRN